MWRDAVAPVLHRRDKLADWESAGEDTIIVRPKSSIFANHIIVTRGSAQALLDEWRTYRAGPDHLTVASRWRRVMRWRNAFGATAVCLLLTATIFIFMRYSLALNLFPVLADAAWWILGLVALVCVGLMVGATRLEVHAYTSAYPAVLDAERRFLEGKILAVKTRYREEIEEALTAEIRDRIMTLADDDLATAADAVNELGRRFREAELDETERERAARAQLRSARINAALDDPTDSSRR